MIIKRLTLAVLSGVVPSLSVLPQASETVELGFTAEDVACAAGVMDLIGFDVYLNLRYVLNRADSLLPAGSEVAYDQICLNEADLPVFRNKSGLPSYSADGQKHMFSGLMKYDGSYSDRVNPWTAEFDAETGSLVSYIVGDKEMLKDPLMPSVTRACTENDLGAGFDKRSFVIWRFPEFKVASFAVEAAEDCYKVAVEYAPIKEVTSAKSSPSAEASKALFILHEGTKVTILDSVGNWNNIELADGRQGWIPSADITVI